MKKSISETTNEMEIEFYKWFNPDNPREIPPTKFEGLLEGFIAGWKVHKRIEDNNNEY